MKLSFKCEWFRRIWLVIQGEIGGSVTTGLLFGCLRAGVLLSQLWGTSSPGTLNRFERNLSRT